MTSALITPDLNPEEQQRVDIIFKGIEAQLGFVPDGMRLFSTSPPLLESFMINIGYFMVHTRLSQELLASIRYLVSAKENCSFCVSFNAKILINLGLPFKELKGLRENHHNAPLPEGEKILLNIALASINDPKGITKEDIDQAKRFDFTERDVFDVVVMAASNKAFTHVLRSFNITRQGTL